MSDYKRLYLQLFNAVTDAIEALRSRNYDRAEHLLISAQQKAEEVYIRAEE